MLRIDHFALATADLDLAVDDFETLSGVRACEGGSHEGQGTRNALTSIGDRLYLAIDAPDPLQDRTCTYGAKLAALPHPVLNVYACETDDIQREKSILEGIGYKVTVVAKRRTRANGEIVATRVIEVAEQPFGIAFPLIMQWIPPHTLRTKVRRAARSRRFGLNTPKPPTFDD